MILITGATGFIGKNLVKSLSNENIICLVRKSSNIKLLKELKIKLAYGDLTDKNSLDKSLKNITTVIHLAAAISINKEELKNVNLIGTKNLIQSCEKNNVKKIIVLSSMAATRKYLDNYGKSKKIVERLVKESKLNYTILRPTLVYGENSNSLQHIINHLKKFPFIIPLIGKGKSYLQPVDVKDVVKVIITSINKKPENKTYNLLGGTKITMNYFMDMISSRLNLKKIKIHVPTSVVLTIVSFFRMFYKNFPISIEFVKSMDQDVQGTNKDAEKDFNIKFKKLSESFQF